MDNRIDRVAVAVQVGAGRAARGGPGLLRAEEGRHAVGHRDGCRGASRRQLVWTGRRIEDAEHGVVQVAVAREVRPGGARPADEDVGGEVRVVGDERARGAAEGQEAAVGR